MAQSRERGAAKATPTLSGAQRSQKPGPSPSSRQQLPVHVMTPSHVNASPVACKRAQEASRHLPLDHSCPHVPLSMTGFRSQPLVEPAGIQTVWVEQEGQKEKGPKRGRACRWRGRRSTSGSHELQPQGCPQGAVLSAGPRDRTQSKDNPNSTAQGQGHARSPPPKGKNSSS